MATEEHEVPIEGEVSHQFAEFALVVLMLPLPAYLNALSNSGIQPGQAQFFHDWYFSMPSFVYSIVGMLGMGALVLFLVSVRDQRTYALWKEGVGQRHASQFGEALLLILFTTAGLHFVTCSAESAGLLVPDFAWMRPTDGAEWTQVICIALINGPAEELLRAYLICRIISMTGSKAGAVLLSAALYAIYHVHYGGVVVSFFFCEGLVFGLLYVWRNSLLSLIIWHVLADIVYGLPDAFFEAIGLVCT